MSAVGIPGWGAPWVVPAAVAVLAAVVLAITGYLILASRHGRHEAGGEEIYDLCQGCFDGGAHCDGAVGSCCCTCGWDEDWAEEPMPGERSPEELGFHSERFATDTDIRGIVRFRGEITQEPAAARARFTAAASHYPGVYAHPPQVPRIAPDIAEQCWCGHGPRGHLPAYVTEVLDA